MTTSNLYVDIHILQDVPPANLNRDETGSPKRARYGGVDRLRLSSQSQKRAARLDFREHMDAESLGYRTRRVNDIVVDSLVAGGVPEEVARPATAELLQQIKITQSKKKDAEASYLLFLSRPQLKALAAQVRAHEDLWASPKELSSVINVKDILGHGHALDVALFGRMVADLPEINVDAAVQVSHALGTHEALTQFDYFTAVDDAQGEAEPGAGMIGTVEFNSATVYRYATVNVPELISNMNDREAAIAGLEQFLRSFTLSLPSGKQNTFAAHTRPGLVWIVVRTDGPVNYMSAFEKPVQAREEGYLASSIKTLASFVTTEAQRWGDHPVAHASSCVPLEVGPVFGPNLSFEEAVATIRRAVEERLTDA